VRWIFLIVLEPAHVNRWLYYVDGGWTQGRAANGRYYWKPDLYDMVKKFTELEGHVPAEDRRGSPIPRALLTLLRRDTPTGRDRDGGNAGAHERLKSFRAKRILLADSIVQVSYRSSSTSCCNNSSYRAAPNLKNGQRRRQRPRFAKKGPKTRSVNNIRDHGLFLVLTSLLSQS
jgi:hypothetical protein